jgi:hypothetical protein
VAGQNSNRLPIFPIRVEILVHKFVWVSRARPVEVSNAKARPHLVMRRQ